MNTATWIVIALVCFVLPATSLTDGGKRNPERSKLNQHAEQVGLPLPENLMLPVAQRIRRRQWGMASGGTIGIAVAALIYVIFFDGDDGAAGFVVMFVAAMGTAFGGAWAITSHRPADHIDQPVVARVRSVQFSDYLTRGERFGLWVAPAIQLAGGVAGSVIMLQPPQDQRSGALLTGWIVTALALLTWAVSLYALRKVLDAPARSATDLELAWDDSERADSLRQIVVLTIVVAAISLMCWLLFIGVALTTDGFYRDQEQLTIALGIVSLLVYGLLLGVLTAGPLKAWVSGTGRGYEQRQLWSHGVAS